LYVWSPRYTNNSPSVTVADVDRMAQLGVQTLYLQSAFADTPDDVADVGTFDAIVARAHQHGMYVVAWFLPTLTDPNNDLRHLVGAARQPVDGVAVDIESKDDQDTNDRNARLVSLSAALRQSLPGRAIGAIVPAPVLMEVVNPNFWPNFPWRSLAPSYDVWLPMSYWTGRLQSSGYKDGFVYTDQDIVRLRNDLGQPNAPVHTIGGTSDQVQAADVDGMVRAARQDGALGGSLYDYRSTADDIWPRLAALHT
jgi:hypothetical protein